MLYDRICLNTGGRFYCVGKILDKTFKRRLISSLFLLKKDESNTTEPFHCALVIMNDGNVDNVTKYEYNNLGSVTKMVLGLTDIEEVVNPEIHQVTSYLYNSLNQLKSVTNPEGITESYTYDYLNQNLSKNTGGRFYCAVDIWKNGIWMGDILNDNCEKI